MNSLASLSTWLIGAIFFVLAGSSVLVGLAYAGGISAIWRLDEQVNIVVNIPINRNVDNAWQLWSRGENLKFQIEEFDWDTETLQLSFLAQPYLKYTLKRTLINCEEENFELDIFKSDSLSITPNKYVHNKAITKDNLAQIIENKTFSVAIRSTISYVVDVSEVTDYVCHTSKFVLNPDGTYELLNPYSNRNLFTKKNVISDLEKLFEWDSISRVESLKELKSDQFSIRCFSAPELRLILFVEDQVYVSKYLQLDPNKEYTTFREKYFAPVSIESKSKDKSTTIQDTTHYFFEEVVAGNP